MKNKRLLKFILAIVASGWFLTIMTFGIVTKKFTWHTPLFIIIFMSLLCLPYYWYQRSQGKK